MEKKYIELEKAIAVAMDYDGDGNAQDASQDIASALGALPAVKIVRCKDCKHNCSNWEHDSGDITDYTDITCDYFMTDGMSPCDYCSRGERFEK